MITGRICPQARFPIGAKVRCYRKESTAWAGFDFIGHVLASHDAGDHAIEYMVSNAPMFLETLPLLTWENEMELAL